MEKDAGKKPALRKIEAEMETLRRMAITHGASNARVIDADIIPVDPRVRFKCMIPKCYMSGRCGHCPPYGYSADTTREIVNTSKMGVFFHVRVDPAIIAAKNIGDVIISGKADDAGNLLSLGGHYMLVYTLVHMLRKKAADMGMNQTHGFAAGCCKDVLCFLSKNCRILNGGDPCRNPEMSVPSLESAGIDAFRLAARVGWSVYPIGGSCEPRSVKRGMLMGMVLAG